MTASVTPHSMDTTTTTTTTMAHEAELILPGSFVVLQGSAGDGVRNTLSTHPDWKPGWWAPPEDISASEPSFEHVVQDMDESDHVLPLGQLAANNTTLGGLTHLQPSTSNASNMTDDSNNFVVVSDPNPQNETSTSSTTPRGPCHTSTNTTSSSSSSSLSEDAQVALETWQGESRRREMSQQQEWREAYPQMMATTSPTTLHAPHIFQRTSPQEAWWLTEQGKIAILRDVPTQLANGTVLKSVVGALSPGTTVVATELVYLDSSNLQRLHVPPQVSSGGTAPHSIYPPGRQGWICLVKLEGVGGRRSGYAVQSLDGYPLLAPGLPSMYMDPTVWIWRVTCPAGAFVRQGLDLHTQHMETIPYGSLVRVLRRTVNGQGLCRLLVDAQCNGQTIQGWCSEGLNPLSGNRGQVLEPLTFPVPALYKVTLPEGAVIRRDRELSTPQIGLAPMGTLLKVVGRAYSEHPIDQCIERLQLAGNAGWISVRLNRPRPHDDLVVTLLDADVAFDPDAPHLYHWAALYETHENHQTEAAELSSIETEGGPSTSTNLEDSLSSPPRPSPTKTTSSSPSKAAPTTKYAAMTAEKCLICLTEDRNATIVHHETGHIACCLVCARILKARGDKCPVCRLPIDAVIQHFWA